MATSASAPRFRANRGPITDNAQSGRRRRLGGDGNSGKMGRSFARAQDLTISQSSLQSQHFFYATISISDLAVNSVVDALSWIYHTGCHRRKTNLLLSFRCESRQLDLHQPWSDSDAGCPNLGQAISKIGWSSLLRL